MCTYPRVPAAWLQRNRDRARRSPGRIRSRSPTGAPARPLRPRPAHAPCSAAPGRWSSPCAPSQPLPGPSVRPSMVPPFTRRGPGVDGRADRGFRQPPWGEPPRPGGQSDANAGRSTDRPIRRRSVRPPGLSPHGSSRPKPRPAPPATCPPAARQPPPVHPLPRRSARATRRAPAGVARNRTAARPSPSVLATAHSSPASTPAADSASLISATASRAARHSPT